MSLLYTFTRTQRLSISIEEAWKFFSSPKNLPLITPPSLDFVVTSTPAEEMYAGMLISYTVRPLFGIKMRWLTEITQVKAPYLFIDEQRIGPYRVWHHEHSFKEITTSTGGKGTEVLDHVQYALYPVPFTGIIQKAIVQPELEKIFSYRTQVLRERFGECAN